MKRNVIVLTVLILVLAFASMGCKRTAPVQDYGNTGLSSSDNLTANQVGDAIVRAGASIGWKMDNVTSDLIMATWTARGHSVTVDIPYTANEYTIKYRDSSNMNAKDGMIHSSYGRWVERLKHNIDAEISKLQK